MTKNKLFIASGSIVLVIGVIMLFPLDAIMNSGASGKSILSFSGIILGLLLLLYGFFNKDFFKSLAIIGLSVLLSVIFWSFHLRGQWGDKIILFWVGVPSGLISGVLFLTINKYILSKKWNKNLMATQMAIFLLLVAIANFLFYKGGDILSYISEN